MANTLDDVLVACDSRYNINAENHETRDSCISFLRRQQKKHNYDLDFRENTRGGNVYFDLLADKLFIFSILAGMRKVKDVYQNETLVDSDDKLILLRSVGTVGYMWSDDDLYHAYCRMENAARRQDNKKFKYMSVIDDVGQDKEIAGIWGRKLNYKEDIGVQRIKRILSHKPGKA